MLLYAGMADAGSEERENNPTKRNRERKRTNNPVAKESYNDRISSVQQITGTASLQFVHEPTAIDDAWANFRFNKF